MDEYRLRSEEVDILDFMFYLLERWRWIVVSMLIFAILVGGYKYRSVINANQIAKMEVKEDKTEVNINKIEMMEYNLEQQENYLINSVVMQMNSLKVSTGTLNYRIECEEHQGDILAAYLTYVSSGELAKQLYTEDISIPVEDLQHLISFIKTDYMKDYDTQVYHMLGNNNNGIFQIQIKMPDDDLCKKYLKRIEELITKYASIIQMQISKHKLTLLSSVQTEMTDLDLQKYQKYQSDVWLAYMDDISKLETLKNKSTDNVNESKETINPISSILKYVLLGLMLGMFIACLVLMILYLLSGRLQNIEDFKNAFGIPLLGIIRVSGKKKNVLGFIDNWIFSLRERTYAKISVEEQIKMVAVNVQSAISKCFEEGKSKKIMLAGTVSEKDIGTVCKELISEIKSITCSSYMQTVYHASALKEMEHYDAVIFIEKRGASQTRLIMQEKSQALERGVKILGAVVVS